MTDDLLKEEVCVALALAEDDFDAIVSDLCEEYPADAVRAAVTAGFAEYRREQRAWGGRLTDAERFLAACRDLDAAGITARADYACCRDCGLGDIVRERPGARGYVFCDREGVARAALGEGLELHHGASASDADPAKIAEEVAGAIAARGLEVRWDGDPRHGLRIPMTWRRRRYGRLANWPEPGTLTVAFHDEARERSEPDQPMSFAACRGVLYDLVPEEGGFIICAGRSGLVVQAVWERGHRFWMEHLDQEAGCSHGRHVTLDQAAEVIRALAERDRVVLGDLGHLETVRWA